MEFLFQDLDETALGTLLDMQTEAFLYLSDPDFLRKNSEEMLLSCLRPPHVCIGAYHKNVLAGFGILYFGEDSEENLGHLLSFSKERLFSAANIKLVIVRPSFQGHGLQKTLMLLLENRAKQRGISTLLSTVAPKNQFSRRNMILSGYQSKGIYQKYGGLQRELFCKTI